MAHTLPHGAGDVPTTDSRRMVSCHTCGGEVVGGGVSTLTCQSEVISRTEMVTLNKSWSHCKLIHVALKPILPFNAYTSLRSHQELGVVVLGCCR